MSTGQDIATRTTSIAHRARQEFDAAQVELIRNTVAKDANEHELFMFLELCKRYELDPFAGQIYCAKMRSENGSGGRITIIVGRDGFLSIANRQPDFEGFDSDVVREKDNFKMVRAENGHPKITHEYTGGGKARGPIIGAWAIVYRTGRRPRYFFAPVEEYKPKNENKLKYSPWGSQESVMMEKCAITTALRLAFNITGLVGEEEASRQLIDQQPDPTEIEFGDDEQVALYLSSLFVTANELRKGAFPARKQAMMLRGKTDDERWEIAKDVAEFIRDHGGEVPPVPEVEEAAAPLEGEVVDEGDEPETTVEAEAETPEADGDAEQPTLPVT